MMNVNECKDNREMCGGVVDLFNSGKEASVSFSVARVAQLFKH